MYKSMSKTGVRCRKARALLPFALTCLLSEIHTS